MMARPRIQRSAKQDIHAAWAWLNERNPQAADRMVRRFSQLFQVLAENPHLGRERPELSEGLRSFPADEHVIFYRVVGRSISIQRIIAHSRDVQPNDFA